MARKKQNGLLQDFFARPFDNTLKIGTLIVGIAYLWLFMQLAPILQQQAVMANDISNIKKDVAEIKSDIDGLYRTLLSRTSPSRSQQAQASPLPPAPQNTTTNSTTNNTTNRTDNSGQTNVQPSLAPLPENTGGIIPNLIDEVLGKTDL